VSTKLAGLVARARKEARLSNVVPYVDEELLRPAFRSLRKHAAAGVDGQRQRGLRGELSPEPQGRARPAEDWPLATWQALSTLGWTASWPGRVGSGVLAAIAGQAACATRDQDNRSERNKQPVEEPLGTDVVRRGGAEQRDPGVGKNVEQLDQEQAPIVLLNNQVKTMAPAIDPMMKTGRPAAACQNSGSSVLCVPPVAAGAPSAGPSGSPRPTESAKAGEHARDVMSPTVAGRNHGHDGGNVSREEGDEP
jgi:hypothetical protein